MHEIPSCTELTNVWEHFQVLCLSLIDSHPKKQNKKWCKTDGLKSCNRPFPPIGSANLLCQSLLKLSSSLINHIFQPLKAQLSCSKALGFIVYHQINIPPSPQYHLTSVYKCETKSMLQSNPIQFYLWLSGDLLSPSSYSVSTCDCSHTLKYYLQLVPFHLEFGLTPLHFHLWLAKDLAQT